jgi:hypothetical protein
MFQAWILDIMTGDVTVLENVAISRSIYCSFALNRLTDTLEIQKLYSQICLTSSSAGHLLK